MSCSCIESVIVMVRVVDVKGATVSWMLDRLQKAWRFEFAKKDLEVTKIE